MKKRNNLIIFTLKRPLFRVLNFFLTYNSFAKSFVRLSPSYSHHFHCISHRHSLSSLFFYSSRQEIQQKSIILDQSRIKVGELNQQQQNSYSMSSTMLNNDRISQSENEGEYANKQTLRKHIKGILKSISKESIDDQSNLFLNNMIELDKDLELFKRYRNWCIYLNMPKGELSTLPLINYIFNEISKKDNEGQHTMKIFVPKVLGKGNDDLIMLPISSSEEYASMPCNSWNIPEPVYPPDSDNTCSSSSSSNSHGLISGNLDIDRQFSYDAIDLVIVPCVAFDSGGRRMGHGKGYYDTFLSHLIQAKKQNSVHQSSDRKLPLLIGVCLNEQYIEDGIIPTDEHDIPMDIIVTPQKIVHISK